MGCKIDSWSPGPAAAYSACPRSLTSTITLGVDLTRETTGLSHAVVTRYRQKAFTLLDSRGHPALRMARPVARGVRGSADPPSRVRGPVFTPAELISVMLGNNFDTNTKYLPDGIGRYQCLNNITWI